MKPGRWWRAQNSCVDNAKLIMLGDKAFRNWFNLNCVANEHGGVLPALDVVAVKLRVSPARAAAAITELVAKRLFDRREDGTYAPHDWNEWQFKTDDRDPTNAERQKNFRARQRAELAGLKALRDASTSALRNGVHNGVTSVMAKRPDTEKENITTTAYEDGKGLGEAREGKSSIPISTELAATLSRFRQ